MRSALASYAPRSRFGSRLAVFLLQWDALGWAIEQIGNTVYVGGRFLDVTNGGETWPGWTTRVYGGNSAVQDLHLGDDGWLYVVGNFTTVSRGGNPEAASGAARIDPITGLIDSGWKPAISSSGSVWGVTTSEVNDLVYLSGSFLSVNGLAGTGGLFSSAGSNTRCTCSTSRTATRSSNSITRPATRP